MSLFYVAECDQCHGGFLKVQLHPAECNYQQSLHYLTEKGWTITLAKFPPGDRCVCPRCSPLPTHRKGTTTQ